MIDGDERTTALPIAAQMGFSHNTWKELLHGKSDLDLLIDLSRVENRRKNPLVSLNQMLCSCQATRLRCAKLWLGMSNLPVAVSQQTARLLGTVFVLEVLCKPYPLAGASKEN